MKRNVIDSIAILILTVAFAATVAQGQTPPGSAPDLNGGIQPPVHPVETPHVIRPAPGVPAAPPAANGQVPNEVLAWDAETKEESVLAGEAEAHFKFSLTNVSAADVTILNVATSCGCTTAHLPPMPWKLAAGTSGEFNVTMNLAGKSGTIMKTVTVSTDKGNKQLMVKSTIVQPTAPEAVMMERERNQKMAQADRQLVFKGDCAKCHVEPGEGKMGKELFTSVCGVCHLAEHRASMVADLTAPKQDTGRELWQIWITYGKPGSLMPAFAKSQGGPLTDEQISSLVDYMVATFPTKAVPQPLPSAK
jgi:cytochrome c5